MFLRRFHFLVVFAVFLSAINFVFPQQTINEICIVAKSDSPITSLCWSPDGKIIASNWNKKVVLWDSQSGKIVKIAQEHSKAVKRVRFSKNGKKILSVGQDNTVIIRENEGLTEPVRANGNENSPITDAVFSSDSTSIIIPLNGNTITQYLPLRYTNQYVSKPLFETESPVTFLDSSDDSSLLLAATKEGKVHIFNLKNESMIKSFLNRIDSFIAPKISPDGKVVLSAADEESLAITSIDEDKSFNITDQDLPANCATFRPDGKAIAYASKNGGIKVYDLQSKTLLHNYIIPALPDEVLSLSFSPTGEILLAGTRAGHLLYLNLTNENLIAPPHQFSDDSQESAEEEKETKGLKHAIELDLTVHSLKEKYYHIGFGLAAVWKSYSNLPFYYGFGAELSLSPPDKNYPYKTSYDGIELNNPWLYRGHLFACLGLGHYFDESKILLFGEGRFGFGGNLLFNNELKNRRTSNTAGCILGGIFAGMQWRFLKLNGGVEFDSSLGILAKGGLGAVIHLGNKK